MNQIASPGSMMRYMGLYWHWDDPEDGLKEEGSSDGNTVHPDGIHETKAKPPQY